MREKLVEAGINDHPKARYTETLLLIAGAEVLFTWTFLVLVGLFPGSSFGSLQPISSIVGFAIVGLGILEFGVVVFNVQLIWLLPEDHDESVVAPFLCCYCLLGQVLLMFPPLIIFAIVLVPLVLISIASVGWYFQKFTSLKLAKPDRLAQQTPLSMRAILWMPVFLLVLGAMPIAIAMFFGPYVFEFAVRHTDHIGIVLICSAIGMTSVSLVPLMACYGFLFLSRRGSIFQFTVAATVVLSLSLAILIEAIACNYTSAVMPLVSLAIFMFVVGVWAGFKPWQNEGLQVVIAKPAISANALTEVKFDELQ